MRVFTVLLKGASNEVVNIVTLFLFLRVILFLAHMNFGRLYITFQIFQQAFEIQQESKKHKVISEVF